MTQDTKIREYDIMFVNVVTPLHNGSGEGVGIVDNPILRERTTQFPIIQASSIKGVLRDAYEEKSSKDIASLFGPAHTKGQEHAGAISFGDGQILAFPVRSVKGCFAWVTSPLTLWRFYEKICMIGLENLFPKLSGNINKIYSNPNKAKICPSGKDELCMENPSGSDLSNQTQKVFLEEFPIACEESKELEEIANDIKEKVYGNKDDFLKKEFVKKLILLDEDTFRYFINNATEIVPNIRIGNNGTTEDGSLRYTEYLPAESIMYSTLIFDKSRKKDSLLNAADVMSIFNRNIPSFIQIGGNETTGKGIVKLSLASLSASNSAN